MAANLDELKQLEDYKAKLADRLATWAARRHERSDLFNSTISAGQLALRTLVAICGGAIVSILALIGNLSGKMTADADEIVAAAKSGAPAFAIALIIAGIATGLVYLAQSCFSFEIDHEDDETKRKRYRFAGSSINVACITLTIISFGFFCVGLYLTVPGSIWAQWGL